MGMQADLTFTAFAEVQLKTGNWVEQVRESCVQFISLFLHR